ncbi:hypothetical protein [uncultured Brevundimonas sp.]|uniref:hypothetical protein n=1 Tax=uncultured Brevundimonas sp. TaxID=213418 RepID=UPI0025978565|nr:hypothetical protein [uncultured Brevundimonas sp.]
MIRLIELSGVRLLERSILNEDRTIIPSGLSPLAFANQIANVHFGITEGALFGPPPDVDAPDGVWLEYDSRTEAARRELKSDWLVRPDDLLTYFFRIGFDLSNDDRRLSASASYFTRIIEAGSLGWLNPCPSNEIEGWRRERMAMTPIAANDDHAQWQTKRGSPLSA